jgi:signal transduction histidine kinase
MKLRVTLPVVAVVAAGHVVLALVLWSVLSARAAAAPPAPAGVAAERMAEVMAGAAFRAVITADVAALSELVRRAGAWPEVAYVSVEDADGRVLAHTDPARVGEVGPGGAGRPDAVREVTAPLGGATAGVSAGLVRLGHAAPRSAGALAGGALMLALAAAVAAVLAVPVGLVARHVAARGEAGREDDGDLRHVRTVRQARFLVARHQREVDAVRRALADREAEVQRVRDNAALAESQLELAREELRARTAELTAGFDQERQQFAEELTRLSTQLIRANQDADGLGAEVQRLREAAEAMEREARVQHARFVAYVCYAARAALTPVLGFSRLLLRESDGPLAEGQRGAAAGIHQAGARLLAMTDDLVDLARVEARALPLAQDLVDVGDLLPAVAAAGAERLGGKPDDVVVECAADLPPVRADRRRLEQILLTLVLEPPQNGAVALRAHGEGDAVAIVAAHPETTIPDETLGSLFEPFASLDPGATDDGGRRLRLALARSLAGLAGGSLTVESSAEAGTRFTLRLPAARV